MNWNLLFSYELKLKNKASRVMHALRNTLTFADGEFIMDISSSMIAEDARSLMKHLYEEWVIRMAYPVLKTKVEICSRKLEVDVPEFGFTKHLMFYDVDMN